MTKVKICNCSQFGSHGDILQVYSVFLFWQFGPIIIPTRNSITLTELAAGISEHGNITKYMTGPVVNKPPV